MCCAALLLLLLAKNQSSYLTWLTSPRTASPLLSHIRPSWLRPAGQSRMKPRILRQDRVGEQLSPSSGTDVHCQGLHPEPCSLLVWQLASSWHNGQTGEQTWGTRVRLQDGAESDLQQTPEKTCSQSLTIVWNTQKTSPLWHPFFTGIRFHFTGIRSHWRLRSLPETPIQVALFRAWHLCPEQCSVSQGSMMEAARWKQFQLGWSLTLEEWQWTAAATHNYYWTGKTPQWGRFIHWPAWEISQRSEQLCWLCDEGITAKQPASPTWRKPASKLGVITL